MNVVAHQTEVKQGVVPGTIFEAAVAGADPRWVAWIETFQAWLASKRRRSPGGGENTARAYETAWRQFFRWAQVSPWEVGPELAGQWAEQLAGRGRANGKGGLAASTVNLKLAALTSFYEYVQRHSDLWPADRRNPFQAVERTQIRPYGQASYPEFAEAKQILDACNARYPTGKRDRALILTYLSTLKRSAEILNLTWGDFQEERVRIKAKGGKIQRTQIGPEARQAIIDYITADGRLSCIRPEDYIFIPVDPSRAQRLGTEKAETGAYVVYHLADAQHTRDFDTYAEASFYFDFLTEYEQPALLKRNRPLTNAQVNRSLKKYAVRAGVDVKKAHLHGLRHAGGRRLAGRMREETGGVDYELLMKLFGHSSLTTTQIYTETILQDADNPYQAGIEAELVGKRK